MGSTSQKRSMRDRPQLLGEKLLKIRNWHQFSQRQMLDHFGYTEYHHAFISMWERGHREPPLIALLLYARSINVSTDVLLDDELDFVLPTNNRSANRSETKTTAKAKGQKRKLPT
ncbi:MAG TPA: helix-turn-helix transcriptional regulator, partial [Blastocatellia bacterium]|nr:helix-turn-helix transcriptional regulator [Blastocatellia bacterium]